MSTAHCISSPNAHCLQLHSTRAGSSCIAVRFQRRLLQDIGSGGVSAGRFTEKVRRMKLTTTLSSSIPAQAGIADYLEHGGYDKHLRKLRGALRTQLTAMDFAIERWLP